MEGNERIWFIADLLVAMLFLKIFAKIYGKQIFFSILKWILTFPLTFWEKNNRIHLIVWSNVHTRFQTLKATITKYRLWLLRSSLVTFVWVIRYTWTELKRDYKKKDILITFVDGGRWHGICQKLYRDTNKKKITHKYIVNNNFLFQ